MRSWCAGLRIYEKPLSLHKSLHSRVAVCVSGEHAVILFRREEVCAPSRRAELFIARLILTQRRENTLILSDVYCMLRCPGSHQEQLLAYMNAPRGERVSAATCGVIDHLPGIVPSQK